MHAVAERLAEEASKGRQVIVFTHNILFCHMLRTEVRRSGVALHSEWMSSAGSNRFGLTDGSQKPWQMKRVSERLDDIEQAFAALTRGGYDHTNQQYRPGVMELYSKLRETWERTVEEVLFNNVVQRFRPEVMTQRLEEACIDSTSDYPAIFEGMKRCSHFSGHDTALDLPPELPQSDQIYRDIKELESFANMAINRRKQLKKAQKYEKGVEPFLL